MGKKYGMWKNLSKTELDIVESDSTEEGTSDTDEVIEDIGLNERKNWVEDRIYNNVQGVDISVPTVRRSTRNSTQNQEPTQNFTNKKVIYEMKKLGAYFNPEANIIVQQNTTRSEEN